jgi:hypothetical protein
VCQQLQRWPHPSPIQPITSTNANTPGITITCSNTLPITITINT